MQRKKIQEDIHFLLPKKDSFKANSTRRIAILSGLSGTGKTQAALDFFYHANEKNFYQQLIYLNGKNTGSLRDQLIDKGGLLTKFEESDQPSQKHQKVINWLQQHPGWLLLVDDVDDREFIKPEFEALLPKLGGDILFTTTLPNLPLNEVTINEFSVEESQELAKKIGLTLSKNEIQSIKEKLSGHVLAICQALHYIDFTGQSVEIYLEQFEKKKKELLGEAGHDSLKIKHIDVIASFDLLITKLREQSTINSNIQQAPDTITLLYYLACLSANNIAIDYFADAIIEWQSDKRLIKLNFALQKLAKLSILQITKAKNSDGNTVRFVNMHGLIHMLTREVFHEYLPNAVDNLIELYTHNPMSKLEVQIIHTQGQSLYELSLFLINNIQIDPIDYQKYFVCLQNIISMLNKIESIRLDNIGLRICETLNDAINIFDKVFYEQHIDKERNFFLDHLKGYLIINNLYALFLRNNGRIAEARNKFEELRWVCEDYSVEQWDKKIYLYALYNLANIYVTGEEKVRQYKEAEQIQTMLLEKFKELAPEMIEPIKIALLSTYQNLGKDAERKKLLEEINVNHFSEDIFEKIRMLSNYIHHLATLDLPKANELMQSTLKLVDQCFSGEINEVTAGFYYTCSYVEQNNGNHKAASQYSEMSTSKYLTIKDPNNYFLKEKMKYHMFVQNPDDNYVLDICLESVPKYIAENNYAAAIQVLENALKHNFKLKGPIIGIRIGLTELYRLAGNHEKSEKYIEQNLSDFNSLMENKESSEEVFESVQCQSLGNSLIMHILSLQSLDKYEEALKFSLQLKKYFDEKFITKTCKITLDNKQKIYFDQSFQPIFKDAPLEIFTFDLMLYLLSRSYFKLGFNEKVAEVITYADQSNYSNDCKRFFQALLYESKAKTHLDENSLIFMNDSHSVQEQKLSPDI